MDHDDLLAPDALFEMVKMIRQGFHDEDGLAATVYREDGNDYEMLYTDEDKVDMDGKTHFQPHLKPDFNIDLLRSNNYITHFLAVKRSLLDRVGGIRSDFDGAQDYDFILRCAEQAGAIGHIPRILYHWRCHKESTSENPFSKQYAVDAGKRAIGEHLKRLGVDAVVTPTKDMGFYEVEYPLTEQPLVSIIIPSKAIMKLLWWKTTAAKILCVIMGTLRRRKRPLMEHAAWRENLQADSASVLQSIWKDLTIRS